MAPPTKGPSLGFHIDVGHVDIHPPHVDLGHVDIHPPHVDLGHVDIHPPHVDLGHVDIHPPHIDVGHVDLGGGDDDDDDDDGGGGGDDERAAQQTSSVAAAQQISAALGTFGEALTQRDAAYRATLDDFRASMAAHSDLHQQTVQAITQVVKGVGNQFGQMSTVTATNFKQLQDQIKYLEGVIVALQADVQALKKG
jgi:hypothetical protein